MEGVEPDFTWESEFVLVLVWNVAGHKSQDREGTNNDKDSGPPFDHDFIDFALSDFFIFSKLKKNYAHVVSDHVGSYSGD